MELLWQHWLEAYSSGLREFVQRSRHFPVGGHFIDSYHLLIWLCLDTGIVLP